MSKQKEIREGIARLSLRGRSVFMGKLPPQCYRFADEILSYLDSKGVVLLEHRVQKFNTQTGEPIQPEPYEVLVSLIEKEEDNERD